MHSLEIKRKEQITTALQKGCTVSSSENFCLGKQALWTVFKCYCWSAAAAAVCMRAWAVGFRQNQPRWCNPLEHAVWVSLAHCCFKNSHKTGAQQSCRKGAATGNWEAVKAWVRAVWNMNICGSVIYQYSWCLSGWSMRSFVKTKLCWVHRCLILSCELP